MHVDMNKSMNELANDQVSQPLNKTSVIQERELGLTGKSQTWQSQVTPILYYMLEVRHGSEWLKIKVKQDCVPFLWLQGKIHIFALLVEGLPIFLGLWPAIFKASNIVLLMFHLCSLFC